MLRLQNGQSGYPRRVYVDLTEVISEKDLGVWTTFNLASSVHCQKLQLMQLKFWTNKEVILKNIKRLVYIFI